MPKRTHGRTGTAEYRTWRHMLRRCYSEDDPGYPNYGGRGITICPEWRTDFARFFADMGERPSPAHSIDRRNNDGHYTPKNCRWATKTEQANNRRPPRKIQPRMDLTGMVFGRLTAINLLPSPPLTPARWLCICRCGITCEVTLGKLRSGWTRSCGCLQSERTAQANRRRAHPTPSRPRKPRPPKLS